MADKHGQRGGRVGGLARAKALSRKRRTEIARTAAQARWHGAPGKPAKIFQRRVAFRVSLLLPDGATKKDLRDYVHDAVSSWCGQFRPAGGYGVGDPGDPLRNVGDSTRVTYLP